MKGSGSGSMNWKRKLLKDFKLYAVTDLKEHDPGFFKKAESALKGGVDVLQLRSKNLSDLELYRIGSKLRELTLRLKKLFFINDRLDLALALSADGVHLGQDDLPVSAARRILKKDFMIGMSTHTIKQALQAQKEGADYIGIGPVFATPTKPDYCPVGLELVRQASRKISIPFVAIGGIDASNLTRVISAGAKSIAVVRAVWGEKDAFQAAHHLCNLMEGARN